MISSFLFKQQKAKRFEYTPRYYDEVKEDIAERKKQISHSIQKQRERGIEPTLDQVSLSKGMFTRQKRKKKSLIAKYPVLSFIIISSLIVSLFTGKLYFTLPGLLILPLLKRR